MGLGIDLGRVSFRGGVRVRQVRLGFYMTNSDRKVRISGWVQGVYLTVAPGGCISPGAGAKLSNTRPVGEWSKCCNTS